VGHQPSGKAPGARGRELAQGPWELEKAWLKNKGKRGQSGENVSTVEGERQRVGAKAGRRARGR